MQEAVSIGIGGKSRVPSIDLILKTDDIDKNDNREVTTKQIPSKISRCEKNVGPVISSSVIIRNEKSYGNCFPYSTKNVQCFLTSRTC